MINTLTKNVINAVQLGIQIKNSINKQYKLLEMDIDGLFKSLLLLRKKKYASLKYEPPYKENSKLTQEIKGLDLVRRDWSILGKNSGAKVLNCILSGKPKDEIISDILDTLKAVANDIDNDLIPLEEYAITRQLAKPLEYYTDPKALPHVKVAKRLKEKGETWIKVNAYIPYIVCKPNSNETSKSSIAERSYHPKELKEDSSLIIDKTWYKENQVISIIRRLVKHIEEITLQQLCECLGIEHKHYYTSQNENKTDIETIGYNGVSGMNDYIGLEVSRGIVLTCSSCKTQRRINKMRTRNETINDIVLCTGCNQTLKNFGYVVNVIMKAVKDVMFAFGSKNEKSSLMFNFLYFILL